MFTSKSGLFRSCQQFCHKLKDHAINFVALKCSLLKIFFFFLSLVELVLSWCLVWQQKGWLYEWMYKIKETVAGDQKAIQLSAMKNNFQNQQKCRPVFCVFTIHQFRMLWSISCQHRPSSKHIILSTFLFFCTNEKSNCKSC